MTRLLIDEPPIAISPTLIRVLGGHDLACFAQQVHFVAQSHLGQERDGYRWAVCSTDEWCELVVLTAKQAKRVIGALVDLGVIVREQPTGSHDRTAWTRIDHDALERLRSGADALVPNGTDRTGRNGTDPTVPNGTDDPPSREVERTQKSHADDEGSSSDPALAKACPVTQCAAPAGSKCLPIGNAARDEKGRHVKRVAGAVVDRWWECVRSRTGHPPSAPGWIAMRGLVETALRAGHGPNVVYSVVCSLHADGQTISGQTIDRRLTARERRNGRVSVETQLSALQYDEHGALVQ